jgi:hypothetical protein
VHCFCHHSFIYFKIGLEDIHPPAFYELLNEINNIAPVWPMGKWRWKQMHFGCDEATVTKSGRVAPIAESAMDVLGPDKTTVVVVHHHLDDDDGTTTGERNGITNDSSNEFGVSKRRNKSWGRRQRRGRNGSSRCSYGHHVVAGTNKKEKRRPLLKGAKMIDGRTKEGKRV